jgi:hypothetical protein
MSGQSTTWQKQLDIAAAGDDITDRAPDDAGVWSEEFDAGYGGSQGKPVLAWSEKYVYFPVVYDGAEWIERAPRNPQDDGQSHVGGE